jgi:hypothetical protein
MKKIMNNSKLIKKKMRNERIKETKVQRKEKEKRNIRKERKNRERKLLALVKRNPYKCKSKKNRSNKQKYC